MAEPFYAQGLRFTCQRCSQCCRFSPGYVFLSEKDLRRLAEHRGMRPSCFTEKYCREIDIGGFRRLSLQEKSNYDCIFWENGGCTVYPVRPFQCRSFPFWSSFVASRQTWEEAGKDCPGIGKGELHSRETIEAWLNQRLQEPFITL